MSEGARPSRWSALPAAVGAALFVMCFYGFVQLNSLASPGLRSYGHDWFDHVPAREAQLLLAIVFLAGPATALAGLALARAAGDQLVCAARWTLARPRRTVAALALLAFAASLVIAVCATQHAPLTDDEQIYRFQVGLLRDGLLAAPAPPSMPPFASQFLAFRNGTWTGTYPWGHVALLLPGDVLGYLHLWPHLCAALAVVLVYALGRELWPDDPRAALAAAAFTACSPFLAFTCATLHNVSTSLVAVTAGTWCLARAVRRQRFGWAVLAGAAFGLDIHARVYNAIAVGAGVGAVALVAALRSKLPARTLARLAAGFALGVLPWLALYGYINWRLSGDLLQNIATIRKDRHMFGFWPRSKTAYNFAHTPVLAFGKMGTNFLRLALWSAGSALSLLGVGALIGGVRRRAADLAVLVPVATLLLAYYFFFTSPVYDTGPAYYLDALPFLALATGRALSTWSERGAPAQRRAAAGAGALILVAALTFWPLMGIGVKHVADSVLGPYRAVERAHVGHAVVWWTPPPEGTLENLQSWVMTRRLPHHSLRDDVIYAKDTIGKAAILAAFPDRAYYAIRYHNGQPVVYRWSPGPDPDQNPTLTPLP